MAEKNDGEIIIDTSLDTSDFEEGTEEIEQATESLGEKVNSLGDRLRGAISGFVDSARAGLGELSGNIRQTMDEMRDRSRERSTAGRDLSEDYAEAAEQLEEAKQRLVELQKQRQAMLDDNGGTAPDTEEWRELTEQIAQTELEIAAVRGELDDMRESGAAFDDSVDGEFAEAMDEAAESTDRAGESVQRTSRIVQTFRGIVAAISSGVRAVGSFGLRMLRGVGNGIAAAGRGIRNLMTRSRGAALTANGLVRSLTSIRTLLISRIKNALVSQITSAFTDGVKALALYSAAFDRAVSNIKNRAAELGANLAVTFGSLLRTVEPVITAVLNAVSDAVVKLNAIIASLKGESSMVVAKKQTASYADSLRDTADSAKKAEQAQKKLNATIGTYDEIHKLNGDTSTANTTGNDADAGASTFETVPTTSVLNKVPDAIADAVQNIKAAIAAQDWYGVGAALGEGLNVIIHTVDDWILDMQTKAPRWAAAFAEGLNGLTASVDFWGIGKTLANGLNLIFSTANAFITRYNWGKLGEQISAGINGFIENFKWEEAGATIGNGIQGVLTLLFTTIKNTNWYMLGRRLMAGVSSIFEAIRWGELGQGLAAAFNGVVDFLAGAIERADFSKAATNLATAVNEFFENADFTEAGETFGEAIKKILMGIATFLEDVEWEKVGEDLANFVKGVDWSGVADAFWEAIASAIAAAIKLLWNFFTTLTEDISKKLEEKFEKMNTGSIGGDIILGILEGIVDAVKNIGKWIKEHIFDPFVEGIKKTFGIASPAKAMKPFGENISDGLLVGISEAWKNITSFFSTKLDAIKTTLSNAWAAVKTTASTKWGEIKGAISGAFDKLDLSGKLETVKTSLSSAWESVKTSASTKWEDIKGTVSSKFDSLKSTLTGGNLETSGKGLINSFASGIYTNFDLLKSTVRQKMQNLKDTIAGFSLKSVGENLISGFKQGITDKWEKIKGSVEGVFSGLVGTVKGIFDSHSPSRVFEAIGADLDAGLENGITGGERDLLRTTGNIANAITDEMRTGLNAAGMQVTAGKLPIADFTDEADALSARLATVAERLAAIAAAFRGITPQMPVLATGTVVPARVRVADTSTPKEKNSSDIGGMLGQLIELLTVQATTDRRVQVTVPVQLDRRQLGAAVAEFGLSNKRMTNGGTR